jgi:hypothetical protein
MGAVIGMSVTGRAGDLPAYLAHDVAFQRTLLEASGNELFTSLAAVPAAPEPTAREQGGGSPPGTRANATVPRVTPEDARAAGGALLRREPLVDPVHHHGGRGK